MKFKDLNKFLYYFLYNRSNFIEITVYMKNYFIVHMLPLILDEPLDILIKWFKISLNNRGYYFNKS